MAIQNGFFKSINGDRRYLAEFFTSYFASFIGNGVFPNPSTNLQVINNQNFSTIVRPGKGWINGHYLNNDDNIVINHQPPDGVLRRIDRIVFAVNLDSRSMDIYLKQGTPSSSAVAPSLIRNSTLYELALADIAFNPGAVSISQSNITDQRMNKNLCGIVHGVVEQLDTTTLFNQYQQFLIDKGVEFDQQLAVNQQTFDDWFAQLNDVLNGDVAANLANMIITHTNNATPQKHIEVVNSLPTNLANKGLLLVVDDVDNPNNPPEVPTSSILEQRIERLNVEKASVADLANLSKAEPLFVDDVSKFTDTDRTYVLTSNFHIYYYNNENNSFVDSGRLYQAVELDIDSVKPENTTFIKPSSNLINPSTLSLNKIVNASLQIVDSENYNLTDFIPVNPSTSYWSVGSPTYTEYDANRQAIVRKSASTTGISILTEPNTRFVRMNLQKTSASYNQARLNLGADAGYEPFNLTLVGVTINENSVENNAITANKISPDSVSSIKLQNKSVTYSKRTALGELPLVVTGNNANNKINLSTDPLRFEFIGNGFIFHRDKRYAITDTQVSLLASAASHAIFYNTATGVLTSRPGTAQLPITDEDNILLAVSYRNGVNWRMSINAEYLVDLNPIYAPYDGSVIPPSERSYQFSLDKINGSVSDSQFLGIGEINSPFDYVNDNHTKVYGLFDALANSNARYITKNELGLAHNNIPVNEYSFAPVRTEYQSLKPFPTILLGAAVHGGEGLAVAALYYFCERLVNDWRNDERLSYLRQSVNFKVVPLRNPGAYDQKLYVYPNGVNINRNFDFRWDTLNDATKGSAPFSEVETRIQRDWLMANTQALLQLDLHVRGGRQRVDDDKMMWLSCSDTQQVEIAAETIEKMTNRYQYRFPELRSASILGYATRGEASGTLRSYSYNSLGISTITWEGFSRSTSFAEIEDAKVVNMNVDFLIQMIVDIVKKYQ